MAASDASVVTASSAAEVAAVVASCGTRLQPVAGGTKIGEQGGGDHAAVRLDLSALAGVVDYQPSEFTVTVRSGTTLDELAGALAAEAQFLPFDPPRFAPAATIGGTVAAGLSGPCRLRYGGVRDFLLAVEMIDGLGRRVRGGCRVVKNSAGFDLPKLLAGSWGTLGVILQLTLKVFPRPQQYRTVAIACSRTEDALRLIFDLARSPMELDGLDIRPPATVLARVSGDDVQTAALAERICRQAGRPTEIHSGNADREQWVFLEPAMPSPAAQLIRVPLTADRLLPLEQQLGTLGVARRYCAAGNVAWIWLEDADQLTELDALLGRASLQGRVIRGVQSQRVIGDRQTHPFADRVREALDPQRRFFDPNRG